MSFGLTSKQRKYVLEVGTYAAKRQKGRVWQLPPPENFFGFPDESVEYFILTNQANPQKIKTNVIN